MNSSTLLAKLILTENVMSTIAQAERSLEAPIVRSLLPKNAATFYLGTCVSAIVTLTCVISTRALSHQG